MSSSTTHILRLRRTDLPDQHILLHVSPAGSNPLDLKLIASESEHVYQTTITNPKSLQTAHYTGSLDEWTIILRYILLQETPARSSPLPELLQHLDLVSSITGTTLTLTLRKSIAGITQRLGTIVLPQNDNEEINLFDWASVAISTASSLRDELSSLQHSLSSHQETVKKLEEQLNDLIQAKKSHEEDLLRKFAALLNAKKLKIRDQQRLLTHAKIDPEVAARVKKARQRDEKTELVEERRTVAGRSRKGKRKVELIEPDPMAEEEEEDDDDDEATEDDEAIETPEDSDQEPLERLEGAAGGDEGEEEGDGFDTIPAENGRKSGASRTLGQPKGKGSMELEAEEEEPPPRRELPFVSKQSGVRREAPLPPSETRRMNDDEDEGDETDDEEL